MNLPKTVRTNKDKKFIQEFLGYNHNLRIASGEFYDMSNISLDNYPVISTRHGEVDRLALSGNPNGLHEYIPDTLMAVCGSSLYVGITADSDGELVEDPDGLIKDSEKSFATIGIYTLIMPDRVLYNADTKTIEPVQKWFTSKYYEEAYGVYLIMRTIPCDIEGNVIDYVESDEPPGNTKKWWYDTENEAWKKYSATSETWVTIETTYTRLQPALSYSDTEYERATGTPEMEADLVKVSKYLGSLHALDTITYSDIADSEVEYETSYPPEWWTDYVIQKVYKGVVHMYEDVSYVVVINSARGSVSEFTITNKCPRLDHVVSLNNRIWGVHQDDKTHEIFACKLGDPTQWYNFAGIASDSYAVSLGFADEVTAGIAYNNYVHFFTDDKIIKIYGDYPSNYQLRTVKADGVVSGGHDTLVQVEGMLFWVSPIGVVSYDGSLPYFRGEKFSPYFLYGKTVAAGRDGTKYCLSVSENGKPLGVFIYDTLLRMWVIGGDQLFAKTAQLNNALCVLNTDSHIITYHDRNRDTDYDGEQEETIEWFLDSGRLGLGTPFQKYISRIQLRIECIGTLKIEILYDNDSEYETVHESENEYMRSITVPIKVKRCDHFRMKLSGAGQMNLYSIGYDEDEGSERCLI